MYPDRITSGNLRRREDVRRLLQCLAYDDIDLVEGNEPSHWDFTLAGPTTLVVNDCVWHPFTHHLEVVSHVSDEPRIARIEVESLRMLLYAFQRPGSYAGGG